ncbi:MAG: YhcH/YjgK/YiaL family protein [Candidatus Methylacidiphilales bacterium]|nr:YhcH/YjgK/YiaL family protein [Candidatus Methylacidiphilales bacterium]
MIYDQLPRQGLYRHLHPGFAAAFDYLLGFEPATLDGRVDLDGDRCFALIQTYETQPATDKKYEAHLKYIDLQYLISGEEVIYHRPLALLREVIPYIEEKDVAKYEGDDDQALVMRPGDFSILYPHDGHKPGCTFRTTQEVRKVVFKIAVASP